MENGTQRLSSIGRRVALTLILAGALALPSGLSQAPVDPAVHATDAEYAVYSAYIIGAFTGKAAEDRIARRVLNIVIVNKTQSDLGDAQMVDDNDKPMPWKKIMKYLRKEESTLKRDTLDSFRRSNNEQVQLGPSFRLPVPYQLVDAEVIDKIFQNAGWWPDFYKKFPGSQGYLVLSRVGFSADGKQALLYAVNSCGGKCASGTYVVMEKRDSKWTLAKEIYTWVS